MAIMIGVRPGAEASVSVVPDSIVGGSFLRVGAGTRRLPSVVIGARMAEDLRIHLGQKLVLQVPGEAGLGAFRVSGLYRTTSSEGAQLRWKRAIPTSCCGVRPVWSTTVGRSRS